MADRLVIRLLDAAELQRLRRIRALGLASLAFPGGEHSRFAHAVGSAYVMRRYLQHVQDPAFAQELSPTDRLDEGMEAAAMAAALLHDLGHGPYSHTFEDILPNALAHEDWTSRIILDSSTEVHQILKEFDPTLPRTVERLIHGESSIPHLSRAVSGTFDVDRCDYLLRDSHMTGVRYGMLDLDWLLASLRLHCPKGSESAVLAVDGGKGLTAVEGFFLSRLYMYRQVYLHKAVRAAEAMVQTLFRRLFELGAIEGVPSAIARMFRGEDVSVQDYLMLDDHVFESMLVALAQSSDTVVAELAKGLRTRKLFKTLSLKPDADPELVRAKMASVLSSRNLDVRYYGLIDRIEVEAYAEDHALTVLEAGGESIPLLEASPMLRGLSRESFVHHRAVFPALVRNEMKSALAEFQ